MIPAGRLPLLMLLVLGGLWGLSFSLSKLAVIGGIHPTAYVWWQSTGATIFLFLIIRRTGTAVPTGRRHLAFYAASALVGLVLPNLNIVMTARYLPAGILSTLVTTVPMMTYAVALAWRMERFDPRAVVGLVLGLAGVLLIVGPDASLPDPTMAPWVLVAMITPVLYASQNIISAKLRPENTPSLAAALGMVVAGSLMSLPVMLASGGFRPLFSDGITAGDLAMVGQMIITCLAYLLYFEIAKRAGPVFVSQVGYVVNIFGLGWGYLFFAEVPSPWIWAAIALVFAGVWVVNRTRSSG
ncbi:MAG: DMT family transporter [Alphaproteobacteria bacterium]|nr:DMT family transporter [Alphaproteobacteria bacterium]